ncbi:hypothetical protein DPMN_079483 [Dreissena polymorpha]|uniref:Uncharacterized protein n=1 Tax=Dreissena polymorpha TaxID=45954 RepID=A0A9D3YPL0_DREPO|nr:hypothetical protein DPMN_079483 [Dreissena polymorpha]
MLQGPNAPNPRIRTYSTGPIYSWKHIPARSSTAQSCQIRQGRETKRRHAAQVMIASLGWQSLQTRRTDASFVLMYRITHYLIEAQPICTSIQLLCPYREGEMYASSSHPAEQTFTDTPSSQQPLDCGTNCR